MFRKFRVNIIIRIILFSFFLYLFIELWNNTTLYAATFVVGIAAVFQVLSLINYVEKTNRDLSRFLDAIKYSDFSQNFSIKGLGSKFDELNSIFSEVIKKFQEARAEKEEHFNYLQTIVQHVGIGLITFQKNGDIQLINNAAKRLLNTPHMRNIRALKHFSEELVGKLLKIKAGDKTIVKVNYLDDMLQLAIYGAEFKLKDKMYTLVSIQNIQTELEEQEMESWQKLIRVLTHEIMNSITPITSLAETINDMLNENSENPFEHINDIQYAVSTIQKRSEGLHTFVEKYRSLTRLPRPEFRIFSISELFTHIHQLMETQLKEKNISFQISIKPDSLELTADASMIEQVLINLLKNAIHALEGKSNPLLELSAGLDIKGRIIIRVKDNGMGITEEAMEKIFIPFFTTKKEGSGIGLSLSRQIMRLHKGNIYVHSTSDEQTTFTLKF